jgi:hypothetical protein
MTTQIRQYIPRSKGQSRTSLNRLVNNEIELFMWIRDTEKYLTTTVKEFIQIPLNHGWCCTNRSKAKLFCTTAGMIRLTLLEEMLMNFSSTEVIITPSDTHNFCFTIKELCMGSEFTIDFFPRDPTELNTCLQLFSNQNPVGRKMKTTKWTRIEYEKFCNDRGYSLFPSEFRSFFAKWNEMYFECSDDLFIFHDIYHQTERGFSPGYISNMLCIRKILDMSQTPSSHFQSSSSSSSFM